MNELMRLFLVAPAAAAAACSRTKVAPPPRLAAPRPANCLSLCRGECTAAQQRTGRPAEARRRSQVAASLSETTLPATAATPGHAPCLSSSSVAALLITPRSHLNLKCAGDLPLVVGVRFRCGGPAARDAHITTQGWPTAGRALQPQRDATGGHPSRHHTICSGSVPRRATACLQPPPGPDCSPPPPLARRLGFDSTPGLGLIGRVSQDDEGVRREGGG